jgi:glyoxylase-like metal-dependent hydrolase (beta-lactamase superfamily II)
MTENWFEIREIEEGVWALAEPHHVEEVVSYLVVGSEQGLLIDTGLGVSDLKDVVTHIAGLPVMVVNTHTHFDRIGCNRQFTRIAVHRAEAGELERGIPAAKLHSSYLPEGYFVPASKAWRTLDEGDTLDLGGRCLDVLHTPGHSPGSICLWDQKRKLLFTGDTICQGPLYANLPASDFGAYRESIRRLCGLAPQLRMLLPGHCPTPIEPIYILQVARGFQEIVEGGVGYWYEDSAWGKVRVYHLENFDFYLPEK